MRSKRGLWVAAALTAGCASDGLSAADRALCEEATAKIGECNGTAAPSLDGCDGEKASAVLDASCDDIQAAAAGSSGKADGCNPYFWWTCVGGGGGGGGGGADDDGYQAPTGNELEVRVNTCGGTFGDGDCQGTSSSPCTHVVVKQGNRIAAEGYTAGNGIIQFGDLEPGDYKVHVERRDGSRAQALTSGDSYDITWGDATSAVTIGGSGTRVDFDLKGNERELTYSCATLDIMLDMRENGAQSDGDEVEWDWVSVTNESGETDYSHLFCDDAYAPLCKTVIRHARPGVNRVELHRVSVPEYDRSFNRSEEYFEERRVDAEPIVIEATLDESKVNGDLEQRVEVGPFTVDDPTPGE